MATYVPNADDLTQPTEDKNLQSAAEEFRTLKAKAESNQTRIDTLEGSALQIVGSEYLADADINLGGNKVVNAGTVEADEVNADVFRIGGVALTVADFDPDASSAAALRGDLSASTGAAMVGKEGGGTVQDYIDGGAEAVTFVQAGTGAVSRTTQSKLRESVSAKDFGVVGDYDTDDTTAFEMALSYCATAKKTLDITDMNIRLTRSVDLPSGIRIKGSGGANIQTWMPYGDKLLLRPGFKSQISGSNIFLSGTADKTYTTNRIDGWASFTYGLSYLHIEPYSIDGVGIILDCDVYDAGGAITPAASDNRAVYDVGLVVRSQLATIQNSNLFGYWGKASFVVHSQQDLENIDSDYIRAINTNFTSIALIGDQTGANGLTGFSGLGCGYYSAADHHVPEDGNYLIPAIYIDGDNLIAGIRGHRFDGNLRTRSNIAVSIDRCDDVRFDFYVVEVPTLAGVPNADAAGVIQGTANTNDVYVGYVAQNSTKGLGINDLANTITGRLIAVGGVGNNALMVSRNGAGVRLQNGSNGDSIIQLTDDLTSENSQWTILRDDDQSDRLSFRYNNTEVFRISTAGQAQFDSFLTLNNTTAQLLSGAGSPEGVVTAPVGSTYTRTNGGAGTTFYVKESGTGSTGWVAK